LDYLQSGVFFIPPMASVSTQTNPFWHKQFGFKAFRATPAKVAQKMMMEKENAQR
jgi:hypothetical protein